MSYPRISVSWDDIHELKEIAEQHGCFRDDDETTPCIGAMLSEIADRNLHVISKSDFEHFNLLKNAARNNRTLPPNPHANRTH